MQLEEIAKSGPALYTGTAQLHLRMRLELARKKNKTKPTSVPTQLYKCL